MDGSRTGLGGERAQYGQERGEWRQVGGMWRDLMMDYSHRGGGGVGGREETAEEGGPGSVLSQHPLHPTP